MTYVVMVTGAAGVISSHPVERSLNLGYWMKGSYDSGDC